MSLLSNLCKRSVSVYQHLQQIPTHRLNPLQLLSAPVAAQDSSLRPVALTTHKQARKSCHKCEVEFFLILMYNREASKSAANCNVEISFEALLVTIDRAWLHGELFADSELNVSPDVALSPGPSNLQDYINKKDSALLEKYPYFPSYPTAFIIASSLELEFRGDTTHLEEAVESSSFEANLKVGYGPFSLGASHKQDKSSAKTKMETTATGTRISLEAPTIIGWVSTLLPELPRTKGGNSLVQPFF